MSKYSASEIQSARNIAIHLFFFGGPDLRSMTDDELVDHVLACGEKMQSAMHKTGLSATEAASALQRLGVALKGCKVAASEYASIQ